MVRPTIEKRLQSCDLCCHWIWETTKIQKALRNIGMPLRDAGQCSGGLLLTICLFIVQETNETLDHVRRCEPLTN